MDQPESLENQSKMDYTNTAVVLIIAAAVILGALYFLFNRTTIPSGTQTGAALSAPVTVTMDQQNNSNEVGTAVLSESNGQTKVTINLTNEPAGASQPVHIHSGSCPNPGDVVFPLSNVVNGQSTTTINTTIDQLKNMGPLAINTHVSDQNIGTYVSCGDLKF